MSVVVKPKIDEVQKFVHNLLKDTVHKKRQNSLADAAFGLMHSETLRLHQLGYGLARAKNLKKKHATKQIDRLLSNEKFSIWEIASSWVPFVIGARIKIYVALDWTSF